MDAQKSIDAFGVFCRLGIAVAVSGAAFAAQAHVTVSPTQSKLGKQETYIFTVPTEGAVATTAVEIDVPPEVTVISVSGDPAGHSLKKVGDRVVAVRWTVNIPPGGGQQVSLIAQNPSQPTRRVPWKAHQIFADGTQADWIDPPPPKPAPMTRFTP
jgi:uncharacterized protein YcnI